MRTTVRYLVDEVAADPRHMSFKDWHLTKLAQSEDSSVASVLMGLLDRVRWLEEQEAHLTAALKVVNAARNWTCDDSVTERYALRSIEDAVAEYDAWEREHTAQKDTP